MIYGLIQAGNGAPGLSKSGVPEALAGTGGPRQRGLSVTSRTVGSGGSPAPA